MPDICQYLIACMTEIVYRNTLLGFRYLFDLYQNLNPGVIHTLQENEVLLIPYRPSALQRQILFQEFFQTRSAEKRMMSILSQGITKIFVLK